MLGLIVFSFPLMHVDLFLIKKWGGGDLMHGFDFQQKS